MSMNKFLKFILLAFVAAVSFVACGEKPVEDVFDVEFNVPSSITFEENDDMKVDFKILFKKAPKSTDIFVLSAGTSVINCNIINVTESKFTVQFPADIAAITYDVKLRRGEKELSFGKVKITRYQPGSF